jgi:hypothetical protein
MKRIVALLLTAAVLMSFYGCRGGREDMTGDDSSVESRARSEEKAALDEVRKSDLACPDKTVALTEEAAKLWLLAGGKLCAVCDLENEISGLSGNEKKLGKNGVISAEEVIKLSPDYVLLDDSLPNAEELREALSKTGIRCEDTTITSFDDYFSTVKNFCMMTKNAEAYEKAALNVRGRRTAIMRNAADEMPDLKLSLGKKKSKESGASGTAGGKDSGTERSDNVTFELIRVSSDGAAIASNNDWVCSMLEDLGLVNLCTEEEPVAVTWKNAEKSRTTASSGTNSSSSTASHAAESGTAESSGTNSSSSTASHAAESGTAESSVTESVLSGEESAPSEAQDAGTESGADREQASSESEAPAVKDDGEDSTASGTGTPAKTEETSAANDRDAFAKETGKNPDFIFVIYCENEKQYRKEFEELTGSIRGWNSLKAVKSNHMITLPKESFCTLPNDAWDLPMEYLYQSIFLMG